MKRLVIAMLAAVTSIMITACFSSGSGDSTDWTPPHDRNENVVISLGTAIEDVIAGWDTSSSIDFSAANLHFVGTSSESGDVYTWTFTTSSFNGYSIVYTDSIDDITVVLTGQFTLSCVNNENTHVRACTITPLSTNTITVLYGTDSYTLSDMNIIYSTDNSSAETLTLTGSVRINGTSVTLNYTGDNFNIYF